jgi:hypothetical protein
VTDGAKLYNDGSKENNGKRLELTEIVPDSNQEEIVIGGTVG